MQGCVSHFDRDRGRKRPRPALSDVKPACRLARLHGLAARRIITGRRGTWLEPFTQPAGGSDGMRGAGRSLASIALLLLAGCSGGSDRPEGPAPAPPAQAAVKASSHDARTVAPSKVADQSKGDEEVPGLEHSVKVHTDAQGRKWLGDVPYDVFFNDPLAVAAEGGTPAVATSRAPAALAEATSPPQKEAGSFSRVGSKPASRPASRKPEAAAGRDWNALIEMDVLDAEVKRIRNELAAQLQSVPKYNSHFQEIAIAGTTLAAVAEIVAEHPGSLSWKPNAPSCAIWPPKSTTRRRPLAAPPSRRQKRLTNSWSTFWTAICPPECPRPAAAGFRGSGPPRGGHEAHGPVVPVAQEERSCSKSAEKTGHKRNPRIGAALRPWPRDCHRPL